MDSIIQHVPDIYVAEIEFFLNIEDTLNIQVFLKIAHNFVFEYLIEKN